MILKLEKRLKGSEGDFSLDVDMNIPEGSFITIFGRSGVGKTTILRMIAGLEKPDKGFIKIGESVYYDSSTGVNLPPQRRKVGFVFQDYALFPNMTVAENILFGMEKPDRDFLGYLLNLIGLEKLANRKPDTLSGGQKQRVALARAVARKPDVLLLDEPLSALDMETRKILQEELQRIHREMNLTTFLISHDFSEVFRLSDVVYILDRGKIVKQGRPEDVFVQERLSGKVKFSGEIIDIKREDVVYIVSVLIGGRIIKVVADPSEVRGISVGDTVVVASKAFNPFIIKI